MLLRRSVYFEMSTRGLNSLNTMAQAYPNLFSEVRKWRAGIIIYSGAIVNKRVATKGFYLPVLVIRRGTNHEVHVVGSRIVVFMG